MRRLLLSTVLLLSYFICAPSAHAAIFQLTVLPASSSANVKIDLFTPVGNGSDMDTSPLSGFVILETDSVTAPFGTARVVDLSLSNTEAVNFDICVVELFGCLAAALIDAGPTDIQVDLVTPGPTATVMAGSFLQTANQVAVTGMVNVDGTGLADGQIPEGLFLLDGETTGDLSGSVTEVAGVVDLQLLIDATISETDVELGVMTVTTVNSTVNASGTLVQPGDMDCSGAVGIEDVPLLVQALLDDRAFAGCATALADVNEDGERNGLDIAAFLNAF